MGEVLSFSKKSCSSSKKKNSTPKRKPKVEPITGRATQSAKASKSKPASAPERPQLKARAAKEKPTMNSQSIKVWWISQEFDDVIRKAVLEKHIPVEELAAVMAHRLGTLLMTSERSPELTLFCLKVISKITNHPHPGSNAS